MNEMRVPQPEQVAATPPRSRSGDPLRRWTLAILILCVLLFGWTLIADRLTPYTSDASVRTFVVRIRPEVSGKVVEVAVHDNQTVRTGDLLYRIDPTPFRIAVERAEAKLAAAGQAVGASTAGVDAAQAQLVEQIAERDNVREQRRAQPQQQSHGRTETTGRDVTGAERRRPELQALYYIGADAELGKNQRQLCYQGSGRHDSEFCRSQDARQHRYR